MSKLHFNQDVVIHRRDNFWSLMNIRTLTHVEVSASTLEAIDSFLKNGTFAKTELSAIDRTYFSNLYCLMGDPTRFFDADITHNSVQNSSSISINNYSPKKNKINDPTEIITLLKKRFILIDDFVEYKKFFAAQNSLFDTQHIGTFHQQVGLKLLEELRTTSDQWWPTQKFNSSGELLDNAYKFIQFDFFKNFFTQEKLKNKKVLDLGCGTGFYSKHFLSRGAIVHGVDPNKEYIEIAKKNCNQYHEAQFTVGLVEEGNDSLKDSDLYDIIYISDMFLFYTKGLKPGTFLNPSKLLNAVRKHLKPTGYVYLTEPHGLFWQTPWLGKADLPYTIISEYLNKKVGVTPSLSEISSYFSNSGLSILDIFEPTPPKESENRFGKRAQNFSMEFPLWWTFLLTHKPNVEI
ncbi:class I SAM-dependent methyltransferase [Maridesulfovibrio hydrothermalis]|uniref:Methyltransferase domain-containing protein n=1 Tax=Maridesulfovibrio hydrothermalis AM13 = DSM 14728 TaxID=1121451 RepID=L0R8X9_9BACT|nr:class I SAM-dependent methyltransferase [Maridesulfovibrio hydrothermalis]CCO23218.1 protein of unknown function [Maridesulfovibrio hydrothermalis AM13 = DSM 14728]